MYLLYTLLYGAWLILAMPLLLYRAWRYQKYLPTLRQRLGRLPESLKSDGRPTLWFHSCSVGETLSLQPIVEYLRRSFPEARMVFSTITNSGQVIARQRFGRFGPGNVFVFPLDFPFTAEKVLDWIRPIVLVIVDTEIWPNVLRKANSRGIPIVMINGRVSARSFRYYRWAAPVFGSVFENYRALLMKSEEDAVRIRQMGAKPDKVFVTGNIKFDKELVEKQISEQVAQDLERSFHLSSNPAPLIVAGSSHPGEEEILLEVFRRLRKLPSLDALRLMLAPRHPERFGDVAGLLERSGFQWSRRSDSNGNPDAPVLLLDTLGELATAYRFATVAFVCGTLIAHGGQSILEPAAHGKATVIGPSMENFPQIIDEFRARNAVRQLNLPYDSPQVQAELLTEAFREYLTSEKARRELGERARSVFEGNVGAARVTSELLEEIIRERLSR